MAQPTNIAGRRPSVSASDPPNHIAIPTNTRGFVPASMVATSPSAGLSTSPRATYLNAGSFGTSPSAHTRSVSGAFHGIARQLTAFLPPAYPLAENSAESASNNKRQGQQKILLLENINLDAAKYLKEQGFEVDHFTKAFSEDELVAKLPQYQVVGIRSKTKITKRVMEACPNLVAIGCFCIGTNQVDLLSAARLGISVFNSPFSNSRSVAELVIAEIVALSRQIVDRTNEMRQGVWNKVSKGCWEVRGKTLGIIGYGHIGAQLSVLAESFGMNVIYHDVINIMPLGTAQQVESLDELLKTADFVTLHVPEIPDTINMIGAAQFSLMKTGAYFINNARGKVVDLPALCDAVESGRLAGVAVDVYPKEPGSNGPGFNGDLGDFILRLRKLPNVILTPHIGGSTEEAQRAIGNEVATAIVRYMQSGTTVGAVNFPEVDLRAITIEDERHIRVCHVHRNEPGVLKRVNNILSDHNIVKQFSDSKGDIAYVMADISDVGEEEVEKLYKAISAHPSNIRTRLLY